MMQRRINIERWGVLRGWREGDSDRGNPRKGGNTASHLKVLREGTTGKKAAAELCRSRERGMQDWQGLAWRGLKEARRRAARVERPTYWRGPKRLGYWKNTEITDNSGNSSAQE